VATATGAATLAILAAGAGSIGGPATGTGAGVYVLSAPGAGVGSIGGVPERTHYYHLIGDAHLRGNGGATAPEIMNPGTPGQSFGEQRLQLLAPPTPAPQIGDVIRGRTSKAALMVTRVVTSTEVIGEPLPAGVAIPFNLPGGSFSAATGPLPLSGETVDIVSSGPVARTAQINFAASAQALPGFAQFVGQTSDEELGGIVPPTASDGVYWYPRAKAARQLSVTGIAGTWSKGDHLTGATSGATAIVKLATAGALRVVQVVGAFADGETINNNTATGTATITTVAAEEPTGGWWPFSAFPNLRNLGTYFERQPNGNEIDNARKPRVGVESRFIPRAHEYHARSVLAADRGVRVVSYDVSDGVGVADSLEGGVVVQVVRCTGALSASWTPGERLTSSAGDWEGTVIGWNVAQAKLFVRDVNGEVLKSGTLTGATSGTTASNNGSAWGWQKGSRHFELWKANLTSAMQAAGALYLASPAKHEGLAIMSWEAELRPFTTAYACPFPSEEQVRAEWAQCVASMRQALGDNSDAVPVAIWMHRVESQPTIYLPLPGGSIPIAYLLRLWMSPLPRYIANCTIVDSAALETEMAPDQLYLRTLDYPDKIGEALWRHLRFGQVTVPNGGGFELLPVGVHLGQSRQVGFVQPGLAAFGDPELFPVQAFGAAGVNSIDANSLIWNTVTKSIEPVALGINCNGFFGASTASGGPEIPVQARFKMRFSDTASASAKFCTFKAAVGASCKNAAIVDAFACQDPDLAARATVGPTCTVTVLAASGGLPARGRFTAAADTFMPSQFPDGLAVTITGSAGNLKQGAGGNDTPSYSVNRVVALSDDGSWVEFAGTFVAEGPRTFTLALGPPPLRRVIEDEWNDFLRDAHARGYLPVVVYIWDDQSDSDLALAEEYADAMRRWWAWADGLFGKRIKGGSPVAKLVTLHPETSPIGTDEQIATLRAAQLQVVGELQNVATIEIADLPFEISAAGDVVRRVRSENGVHLTALGTLAHGFRADAALGQLGAAAGIPPHPNGELSNDGFGAVNGGVTPATDPVAKIATDGDPIAAAAAASLDASDVATMRQRIEQAWQNDAQVLSYTINGQTVTMNSPAQMVELHRYLVALQQQSAGIRRTTARFN
jgi:hypothetical protein